MHNLISSKDRLNRYLFDGNHTVKVQTVSLHDTWLEIQARHDYPPVVVRLLGELVAASTLLSANLKFNGSLVLQLHGDGPIRLIVVECRSGLGLRATVKIRDNAVLPEDASLQTLINPGGHGQFSLVLDPAQRLPGQQPYQGIVPLSGDTVADVLHHYLEQSEQLETRLWLAADEKCAAGLLLQRMPEEGGNPSKATESQTDKPAIGEALADHDLWNRVLQLTNTLKPAELRELTSEELIQRLYWQETLRVFEPQTVHYACGCSRQRTAEIVKMLGKQEVDSILEEQGTLTVSCDYCVKHYVFDKVDCAQIFAQPEGNPPHISTVRH